MKRKSADNSQVDENPPRRGGYKQLSRSGAPLLSSPSSSTSLHQLAATPTTTGINALPSELLTHILLHLPLCDRVRVGRVCARWRELSLEQNWRDVHHYDDLKGSLGSQHHWKEMDCAFRERRKQLLTLIGPHLKSIRLAVDDRHVVHGVLRFCPDVKHLALRGSSECEALGASAYDSIRLNYGDKLKTLSLKYCVDYLDSTTKEKEIRAKSAFYKLLRSLSSLEYLYVRADWIGQFSGIKLSSTSMSNLRKLVFYSDDSRTYSGMEDFTNEIRGLASSLPPLRSLGIFCSGSIDSYNFLREFQRLEHLAVDITSHNFNSLLVDALPHMSSLRALELETVQMEFAHVLARLTAKTSSTNPQLPSQQLEHISVRYFCGLTQGSRSFELFPTTATGTATSMERLRSLELWPNKFRQSHFPNVPWKGRLKETPLLEHLVLKWPQPLPLHLICGVVKEYPHLRYLDVGNFKLDANACNALASAALDGQRRYFVERNGAGGSGDSGLDGKPSTLTIRTAWRENAVSLPCNGTDYGCSRLRFVSELMPSQVLLRYAYGCLSDGKPKFDV